MFKDYYVVLGISKGADLQKIKKAYRMVLKKYHPDTAPDSESTEKLLEIKEAYNTLADENKRREYDKKLEKEKSREKISRPPGLLRQPISRREMGFFKSKIDEFFEGFVPLAVFSNFFEKQRGKGKDLFLEVILSPQEARRGGLIPLHVPVIEPCSQCCRAALLDFYCCSVCYGRGTVTAQREFLLNVPAGVEHGTKISLSMECVGLSDVYLDVDFSICQRYRQGFWKTF